MLSLDAPTPRPGALTVSTRLQEVFDKHRDEVWAYVLNAGYLIGSQAPAGYTWACVPLGKLAEIRAYGYLPLP